MYAAFKKERKGNSNLHQFTKIDGKICLFGRKNGWIPWLLEMAMPKGQDEPYRWHLCLEEALGWKKANEYAAKQYNNDVNAVLINIKPGSHELFLCELLDVWGFSAYGWTPMLWHLRVLEPKNTKCTPNRFDDFTAAKNGDAVYEFLYMAGTVKKGKIDGTWIAPKSSPTNAALLWPEPLNYFMECIKGQTRRAAA
jgi:hypothetical protein